MFHSVLLSIIRDLSERAALEAGLPPSDELEERVQERTAALTGANASLQRELEERTAAQRQSLRLFHRLVSVQEEERGRIARSIHDRLGQYVTALRMNLDALAAGPGAGPRHEAQTRRAQMLVDEIDRSLDVLASDLKPAALDHLGLAAGLRALIKGWSHRYGITGTLEASGFDGLRLPLEIEINLYRIAQEALNNVAAHAGAASVVMVLARRERFVGLVIEDDGCGFDPAGAWASIGGGLGLVSMCERAMLIGGSLDIDSAPGRGTTLIVHVPVHALDV
jgi:signal transduction histidine kinase